MKKVLAMLVATSMLLSMSVCFAGGTEEEELAEVTAVEETVVEEATEEAAEEVTEDVGDGESAAVEEIAAPANCVRLNMGTPCTTAGKCCHCNSEGKICCDTVIMGKQRTKDRIKVILIGEELGY